jgi:hypothetical protein
MTDAPEPEAARTQATDVPAIIQLPDLSQPMPKKPKRQRQHLEHFRTDDAEHAELAARARDTGLSVNAFCRMRALGSPGPRSRRNRPEIDEKLLARNNAELNRIGSNLNQAVRALNDIALTAGTERLAQVAHLVAPIEATLADIRLTLTANRRALGYDSEG